MVEFRSAAFLLADRESILLLPCAILRHGGWTTSEASTAHQHMHGCVPLHLGGPVSTRYLSVPRSVKGVMANLLGFTIANNMDNKSYVSTVQLSRI